VERFDQDLFALDSTKLPEEWPALGAKYPSFDSIFLKFVLNLGPAADSPAVAFGEIRRFLAQNQHLKDSVVQKFGDFHSVRGSLENYFRYLKYYYPDYPTPTIITFIGNFGGSRELITASGDLAIGLDFYMGAAFSYYQIPEVQEVYPTFVTRKFSPEYIPVDCMSAIVDDLYPAGDDTTNLIQQVIDRGRRLYLLDKLLPGVDDTLKIGYTGRQYAWCKANEGLIWNFLVTNHVLYSFDPDVIKNYMGDAPTTQNMGAPEAPGNIGSFVGWQIVRRYLSQKGDIGPKQLMTIAAKDILSGAQYNPK
jgi:hypothetical protein